MRYFLPIPVLVTLLAACGVPQADFDALQARNSQLEAELSELRARKAAREAAEAPSRVVLADTEARVLRSAFNGQRYLIKVKLPRGYDDEDATYPVLYVLDAETNFGGVSYIVQRLIKDHRIPKILVVGVAYDTDYRSFYALRSRDLTPTEVGDLRIGGAVVRDPTGGAPAFSRFLAEELFPFVERTYRAEPGDRALYGHSYGGLFGTWVLLHHAGLFNRYLLLSPSLWYDDSLLLRDVETTDLHFDPTRLYMASGRLEPRIDDLHLELVETLRRRNPQHLAIESEVLENEIHRTLFGAAFTNGLRDLYAPEVQEGEPTG